MPQLLTPAEVAEVLRVTLRTVQRYARDGRLDRVRIGCRLSRYTLASVIRLIEPETRNDSVSAESFSQLRRAARPNMRKSSHDGRRAVVLLWRAEPFGLVNAPMLRALLAAVRTDR